MMNRICHRILLASAGRGCQNARKVRIVPFIACAGLLSLAGCHKTETFPSGNNTPVNASAMPTPEVSATETATTGTDTSTPTPTPGTPSPALLPSPSPG
jgi:hypothetical protein